MNNPATNVNGIRKSFNEFMDCSRGLLEIERDFQHHEKSLQTFKVNAKERVILVESKTEGRLRNIEREIKKTAINIRSFENKQHRGEDGKRISGCSRSLMG